MIAQRFAIFLVLSTLPFSAADGGKVERTGAFPDTTASESVRKALEPDGYRLLRDDGKTFCEVWFRSGIATPHGEVDGAMYGDFGESTFVGVISFPHGGKDFRGQPIRSGSYTLRYGLLPNDGNHLGAATFRDFFLLTQLADDPDADVKFSFEELVQMSRKASGTQHPAVLNLVYPQQEENLPTLKKTDEDFLVLTAHLKTKSGKARTIALVVEGEAEQ